MAYKTFHDYSLAGGSTAVRSWGVVVHTLIELCRSACVLQPCFVSSASKTIFPRCTVGICHFPSSQPGQSKSKLQFENHRGNSVILLTRIILNLIRQVCWPDVPPPECGWDLDLLSKTRVWKGKNDNFAMGKPGRHAV